MVLLMREAYNQRRRYLMHAFKEMGWNALSRFAFFVFPCIKEFGMTSEEFAVNASSAGGKGCSCSGTAFGDWVKVSMYFMLIRWKI